jgi:hypothetical protein
MPVTTKPLGLQELVELRARCLAGAVA